MTAFHLALAALALVLTLANTVLALPAPVLVDPLCRPPRCTLPDGRRSNKSQQEHTGGHSGEGGF